MKLKFKFKYIIKAITVLVILGIIGVLLLAGINIYMKQAVSDNIISEQEAATLNADCILILGAGVYSNGSPSPMLEDRMLQGIKLYEKGASKKLLMSGDHGRVQYDEVNVMKQFAIDKGIPSEDVFMDHAGFSTYESIYRARDIFQAKKIIIITQDYHLYRALYISKELGLDAYGVAANLGTYGGQRSRDLREVLARAKDFTYCLIKPKPTFLGEAIPVSGNGDLTNDKGHK